MSEHIYVIAFSGESKPTFVFAEDEKQAMTVALNRKKDAEILGKMRVKDYMKNEKQIQELYAKKVRNKKK